MDDAGRAPSGGERIEAAEVHTRRLVVADEGGRSQVVVAVEAGTAELRLELPGAGRDARTAVVLFAAPTGAGGAADRYGYGPALGVQLWADGNALAEVDAWPDADGRWRAHFHINGGT